MLMTISTMPFDPQNMLSGIMLAARHRAGKMHNTMSTGLRQWKMSSGTEPTVRIGVVLDEDEMKSIELHPDERTKVTAQLDGNAISIRQNDSPAQRMPSWSFVPEMTTIPVRGAGTLVR